jgi:hypothetical protein
MLKIKAEFDYVLRFDAKIERYTASDPATLPIIYDSGAGTTTIDRQYALNSGYRLKPLPVGDKVVGISGI